MANVDAGIFQPVHQGQQAAQGVEKGAHLGQLRADVAIQSHHLHVVQGRGPLVYAQGLVGLHPELVLPQAGGDIGVGAGVHVGVDPHRDRGDGPHLPRHPVQNLEFSGGFQVEAVNAQLQRPGHLRGGLAHSREHDFRRVPAGGDYPFQLAPGDDIEARTQAGQHVQYRQVGVRLDRVADEVVAVGQGPLVLAKSLFQRGPRVDVAGGAVGGGDLADRDPLGIKLSVPVGKVFHGLFLSGGRCGRGGGRWRVLGFVQGTHLPAAGKQQRGGQDQAGQDVRQNCHGRVRVPLGKAGNYSLG